MKKPVKKKQKIKRPGAMLAFLAAAFLIVLVGMIAFALMKFVPANVFGLRNSYERSYGLTGYKHSIEEHKSVMPGIVLKDGWTEYKTASLELGGGCMAVDPVTRVTSFGWPFVESVGASSGCNGGSTGQENKIATLYNSLVQLGVFLILPLGIIILLWIPLNRKFKIRVEA